MDHSVFMAAFPPNAVPSPRQFKTRLLETLALEAGVPLVFLNLEGKPLPMVVATHHQPQPAPSAVPPTPSIQLSPLSQALSDLGYLSPRAQLLGAQP